MDIISSFANQAPSVAVVGAFIWYLLEKDKKDQKIHEGYQKHISSLTEETKGHGQALQSIYKYSVSREGVIKDLNKTLEKYVALLNKYEEILMGLGKK